MYCIFSLLYDITITEFHLQCKGIKILGGDNMNLSEDVAFALHEQWRQTRLKDDGSYDPRWKKIKDEAFISKFEGVELPRYVRKGENGYEIDIANASYLQLSSDWQEENKEAAKVVAKMIESGISYSENEIKNADEIRNKIGSEIHNAWLERNSWAKDGELGVPFKELPKEEQDKDIDQYAVALKMSKARILSARATLTLEDAVDELKRLKEKNYNVAIKFNGHMLYSEFDTPDTCFLKVCGMTMKECLDEIEKENKRFEEKLKKSSQKPGTGMGE